MSVLPNFRSRKPGAAVSGAFCLMMSASIVTPRWFAWPVRSAASVVVGPAVLGAERGVAQVAPEHGREAQLVRLLEGLRDLDDLAPRLLGAEVDRRADGDGPELDAPA